MMNRTGFSSDRRSDSVFKSWLSGKNKNKNHIGVGEMIEISSSNLKNIVIFMIKCYYPYDPFQFE